MGENRSTVVAPGSAIRRGVRDRLGGLVGPLAVAAVIAVAGSGCGGAGAPGSPAAASEPRTSSPAEPASELRLEFEDGAAELGAVVPAAENSGSAEVESTVETLAGGRIIRVEGRDGGFAIRLPRFSPDESADLAVLRVSGRSGESLNPGEAAFRFGADFQLDAESSGTEVDNGDNLLQRGLYADPAQYKIQLDHGVPSCRVFGSEGEVLVKADGAVEKQTWYRVTCERRGNLVTLALGRFDEAGKLSFERWSAQGPIGAVTIFDAHSPLSVGGKLSPEGSVMPSSVDQFNGVIDNVFYLLVPTG